MDILQANVASTIFEIGTNVTAAGIIIVFSMLILLVLVISLFSKAMHAKEEQPVNNAPKTPVAPKAVTAPAPKAMVTASAQDDDEIIAVIAAAVEAMYAGSGKRGVVRSVKPASATYHKPWAMAGIYENTIAF